MSKKSMPVLTPATKSLEIGLISVLVNTNLNHRIKIGKGVPQPEAVERSQRFLARRLRKTLTVIGQWLECFPSVADLLDFLEVVKPLHDGSSEEDKLFRYFYQEMNIFRGLKTGVGLPYRKFLLWENQTIYSRRHIIRAIYYKFFGNEVKRVTIDVNRRKKKNFFEVTKERETFSDGSRSLIPNITVRRKLKKKMVVVSMAYSMLLYTLRKFGHKDIGKFEEWKTGIARNYGFKFVKHELESHRVKSDESRKRKALNKRISKIKDSLNQDLYLVRDEARGFVGIDILDNDTRSIGKNITRLRKLLKSNYFQDLTAALNSKLDSVVVKIGKKLQPVETTMMLKDLVSKMKL